LSAKKHSSQSGPDHGSDAYKRIEEFVLADKSIETISNIASLHRDIFIKLIKESKSINQERLKYNLFNLWLFLIKSLTKDCNIKLIEQNTQYLRNPRVITEIYLLCGAYKEEYSNDTLGKILLMTGGVQKLIHLNDDSFNSNQCVRNYAHENK
jgi:hypothetical protein